MGVSHGDSPAADSKPDGMPRGANAKIPESTISWLAVYLRSLRELSAKGESLISSVALAAQAGVTPAKLRRDLAFVGSTGIRGVGYEVETLSKRISAALGIECDVPIAVIGMGNLGRALARLSAFDNRGFCVAALFDISPEICGRTIQGRVVSHMDRLCEVSDDLQINIAIVAVGPQVAQTVVDAVVGAGITSILNFSPISVVVPDGVRVRSVDLLSELQILAFHLTHKTGTVRRDPQVLPTSKGCSALSKSTAPTGLVEAQAREPTRLQVHDDVPAAE